MCSVCCVLVGGGVAPIFVGQFNMEDSCSCSANQPVAWQRGEGQSDLSAISPSVLTALFLSCHPSRCPQHGTFGDRCSRRLKSATNHPQALFIPVLNDSANSRGGSSSLGSPLDWVPGVKLAAFRSCWTRVYSVRTGDVACGITV